jgi:hypothetical protein
MVNAVIKCVGCSDVSSTNSSLCHGCVTRLLDSKSRARGDWLLTAADSGDFARFEKFALNLSIWTVELLLCQFEQLVLVSFHLGLCAASLS